MIDFKHPIKLIRIQIKDPMPSDGLAHFVAYVEQGVFPEMLVALKRCTSSNEVNSWMDLLGDYLADHDRMKNYKAAPPRAKEETKEAPMAQTK